MIDINLYRLRIGTYVHRGGKMKYFGRYETTDETSRKYGQNTLFMMKFLLKISLMLFLLPFPTSSCSDLSSHTSSRLISNSLYLCPDTSPVVQFCMQSKKQTNNFKAKYKHGNKQTVKRGIKSMHLNIRSLRNKLFEIKNVIKEHGPHILGLSEAQLKNNGGQYDENELKIPGYSILFPKSWASHGFARVLVYVKNTVEYEQVRELEDDLVQSVWLKASFKGQKKIFFCHCYREHTSTMGNTIRAQRSSLEILLAQWEAATLFGNPAQPNETHVCGDMNLDCLGGKWLRPDYSLLSLSKLVQVACSISNFTQLVTSPTRSQYNSVKRVTDISCIDHVYCNSKFRCSEVSVIPFGNSDHDILSYIRYSKVPPSPARTIRKRSYKNFEKEKFLSDLGKIDWTPVYSCQDVDHSEVTFTRLFQSVINVHAPWVQYQQRKNYVPWLTEGTKLLIKQRDSLKQLACQLARDNPGQPAGDDQITAWVEYKKIRNQINNRKKSEELVYKLGKVAENLDSPEKTWKTAKQFMEWKQQGPPTQLQIGNMLVTKASSLAKLMNDFFVDKVLKIRNGIRNVAANLGVCRRIMSGKKCKLSLKYVNVDKIKKLLRNLKNTKSCAVDDLDNFCVKISSDIIAQPLHHIITLSIMQNKFPTSWKYSKIVPLHKKGCTLERKNYRPVAILSPLGKILEKVAYEQLYGYFSDNKIFHPNLHGYRQNRSTQTALLQMYDRWVRAAHHGQVTGVVLLDLSAAFDLVDHELLVEKLKIYGVDSEFCTWISSYLSDRHQAVWMDHCFSSFLPCSVGVPQGSNLGPLFFLIFYNDLPFSLNCDIDAYADDSTMSFSANNVDVIGETLTSNCAKVSSWMQENKFKLNADKTHILTVGTSVRVNSLPEPVKVEMDSIALEESTDRSEVLLGVQIQFNLKWHKTLEELQTKLKKRLAGLSKLRFIVPYSMLKTITQGIFNSVLVYCLPLFGEVDKGELHSLQVLQNKAAQVVTRSPPRSSRHPMFDKLDWLSVNQLAAYHTLIQVYKIRANGEPEYLHEFLRNDNRNGNIIIPNTELSLAKKSFTFRGAALWNSLPIQIRKCLKIGSFKKLCRKWVQVNIARFLD